MFNIYKKLVKNNTNKDIYVFISKGKKVLTHGRVDNLEILKSLVLSCAEFGKKTTLQVEYSRNIASDALGCDVVELDIKATFK